MVKDQSEYVYGAHLHLLRTNAFGARYPHGHLTWHRTSDQFRFSWSPGPNHTPRIQTAPSHQWKGTPLLQSPNHRPLLLPKLILAPAICSYLATVFFTAFMSQRLDTKTVISSAYTETFAERESAKGILRRT